MPALAGTFAHIGSRLAVRSCTNETSRSDPFLQKDLRYHDNEAAGQTNFREALGFPDSLNKDGHYRAQIGVNRIVTRAVHCVTKHSGMDSIAKNVHRTAEIDIGAYASSLLGRLKTLNQSGSHWSHFFQNGLADSWRQKSSLAHHGSHQRFTIQKRGVIFADILL